MLTLIMVVLFGINRVTQQSSSLEPVKRSEMLFHCKLLKDLMLLIFSLQLGIMLDILEEGMLGQKYVAML